MKRVLVYEYLSGGGLVGADAQTAATLMPLGLSMRDAIAADVLALDDATLTLASGPGVPTRPEYRHVVSPTEGESPFDFVARQAAMHDLVWVVAPETDALLERMQASVAPRQWLGCHAKAIELTSGKGATLAQLAAHGMHTPATFAQSPQTRRWVVKPDDGAGAVATTGHTSLDAAAADAAQRQQRHERALLEPWVEGDALSISLLCSAHGAELISVNRQHIDIAPGGELSFEGVSVNAVPAADPRLGALRPLAQQIWQAIPGLRGFVGIDLVWHAQRGPVIIEVNPRVTCAYVGLSKALGRQLAADIIKAHALEHTHV